MTCVTNVEVDWVPGDPSGQLATDAKIRFAFPNVRTIRNLPITDYALVSWGRSDRITLRVNPLKPKTWIGFVSAGRDFSQMRRPLKVLFPEKSNISFSYNYMARSPKDEDERHQLASFLASSPFIHAVEKPHDPSEFRFHDEDFEAHLRDLVPLPNVDIKSLCLTLTNDSPTLPNSSKVNYTRSATALGATLRFGSKGVRTLTYRCPKGGSRPTDMSIFTSADFASAIDGIYELEMDVVQGQKALNPTILPGSLKKLTLQYPGRIADPSKLADQLAYSLSLSDPRGHLRVRCLDQFACVDDLSPNNAKLEKYRQ